MRGAGAAGLSLLRSETTRRGVYAIGIPQRSRRYEHTFSIVPDDIVESLFHPEALSSDIRGRATECWASLYRLIDDTDELGGLQAMELRSSLPDELLLYADKLSMAHGLEIRVPYLDHEIVKFAEQLPSSFKVRRFKGKWLHRRICERLLPAEVFQKKKLGFETPAGLWLKRPDGNMRANLLNEKALIYKFIRPDVVKQLFQEHTNGRHEHTKVLFSLIVLEEWMRYFIKK